MAETYNKYTGNDKKDRADREAMDIYNQFYTQQFDPAKAGSDAFRRAVATQLRQSYEQQRNTEQSYSDLYQQARRQATRQGAMSSMAGFSGGRAKGQAARASAAEIQALSSIAGQREAAVREILSQRQAIPSNALIEAQQADQYTRAIEAANVERAKSIREIMGSVKEYSKLSGSQKMLLKEYGITEDNFEKVTMASKDAPGQQTLLEIILSPFLFPFRAGMQGYDILAGDKIGTAEDRLGLTAPPSFYEIDEPEEEEE
ncbi:MAG: hypothetical protein EBY39_03250 [Flavobacteriia bacterium]|nr:hypothetical protein [Flavobacteriia bacterium]